MVDPFQGERLALVFHARFQASGSYGSEEPALVLAREAAALMPHPDSHRHNLS
jgi:hypothetical protein